MRLFHRKSKVWSFMHYTQYMAISPALKQKRHNELTYLVNRAILWGYVISVVALFIHILLGGH